ncbi:MULTISPECIES: hypothetical protein [Streptomyces]|uniref:hypothetical protein n=1 Tax=Streptomyces TaxID=1883 RepID=UPI00163C28D0|nr:MULTISPECIES: hypothetical protein [Streptomyces]MBC2877126.1 hypothetical protein [Streptomyces sp. TYQ1024]UBI39399.1 hypothetical protein K7I03_24985 [Streptomyces mobaraensis]UKW31979.1 hypothetical protein MCU78_24920 [Streptomyces sp. TYQ1024]
MPSQPSREEHSRPTLHQQLKARHPLVPSALAHDAPGDRNRPVGVIGYAVLRIDAEHGAALAPLDVMTIKASIRRSLGAPLSADERSAVNDDLKGHLGLLMPIVAGAHPELVASVGRRLEYEPPDGYRYPRCARQWGEESARTAEQLLGLALADEDAEHRHAGVEARLHLPSRGSYPGG